MAKANPVNMETTEAPKAEPKKGSKKETKKDDKGTLVGGSKTLYIKRN